MNLSLFASIDHSCDDTLQWSKELLTQAGLRPVQTFDLHTARTSLHNCPCPNHGTDACDCQLVVLLVYGDTTAPETLILHGNGEKTWLSTTDSLTSNSADSLAEVLKDTLISQKFSSVEIFK